MWLLWPGLRLGETLARSWPQITWIRHERCSPGEIPPPLDLKLQEGKNRLHSSKSTLGSRGHRVITEQAPKIVEKKSCLFYEVLFVLFILFFSELLGHRLSYRDSFSKCWINPITHIPGESFNNLWMSYCWLHRKVFPYVLEYKRACLKIAHNTFPNSTQKAWDLLSLCTSELFARQQWDNRAKTATRYQCIRSTFGEII